MRQVWAAWGDVLVAWAVGIPVLAGAAVALFRRRVRRGMPRAEAKRFTVAEAALVGGTVPWVWMILTPVSGERAVSWVPLRDLVAVLGSDPATVVVQVGANLVAFVPLGFFLPRRTGLGPVRVTLVGMVVSASLEVAQYVLALGRVSSVDDVLVNTAGAALGAWLSVLWSARATASSAGSPRRRSPRPSGGGADTPGSSPSSSPHPTA